MKSKKINWRLANRIASAISTKAFAHLIDPVDAKLNEIAGEAYDLFNAEANLEALEKFELIQFDSKWRITLSRTDDASDASDIPLTVNRENMRTIRCRDYAVVKNDALWDRAIEQHKLRIALDRKRTSLFSELERQLEGSTTAAAIKAWPEAAEIIAGIADVSVASNLTTPLDSLLAKFMPLLPAPQGEPT